MSKLIEYIAEIEEVGVSSKNGEIFIVENKKWKKLSLIEVNSYQKGYNDWLEAKRRENIEISLITLADNKQKSAEKLILGYKATPKQIERYKDKYERAIEGEFDDDTNVTIIQKFEAMRSAIRQFTDMIEEYRGLVDDLIQVGELDKAYAAIKAGKSLDISTTKEDINELFKGF